MFTIKAEIQDRNGTGIVAYQVASCKSYRVEYNREKTAILLYDEPPHECGSFIIGPQVGDYQTVYVMNDRGKTIDTIR